LIAWSTAVLFHLASKPTRVYSTASVAGFEYPMVWATPFVQVLLLISSMLIIVGGLIPAFAFRFAQDRLTESCLSSECATCGHPTPLIPNASSVCSECGYPPDFLASYRRRAWFTMLALLFAGVCLMAMPTIMPRIYLASQGSAVSKMINRTDAWSQYVTWILFGNRRVLDRAYGWS
jgi:hypothetical protein